MSIFPDLSGLADVPTDGLKRKLAFSPLNVAPASVEPAYFTKKWTADDLQSVANVELAQRDGFPELSPNRDGIVALLNKHLLKLKDMPSQRLKPAFALAATTSSSAELLVDQFWHMFRYREAMNAWSKSASFDPFEVWDTLTDYNKNLRAREFAAYRDAIIMNSLENGQAMATFFEEKDDVETQPLFLPLTVAAPPRMGKSQVALLLVSIATKLGFTTMFSVAPHKMAVIAEMQQKIVQDLMWDKQGMKYGMLNMSRNAGANDMYVKNAELFDVLLYSSDVLNDVKRATLAISQLQLVKKPCFHIHDEGQTMSKILTRRVSEKDRQRRSSAPETPAITRTDESDSSKSPIEREEAFVLKELRQNYRNSRGLICLVSATLLPTLMEPMWGDIGILPTRPENVLHWDLSLLPAAPPSLHPVETEYVGVDHVVAFEPVEGQPMAFSEHGMKYITVRTRTTGSSSRPPKDTPTITGTELEMVRAHFNAFLDAPKVPSTKPLEADVQPMYVGNLTRDVMYGTGGAIDWLRSFYVPMAVQKRVAVGFVIFSSVFSRKTIYTNFGRDPHPGSGYKSTDPVQLFVNYADVVDEDQPTVMSFANCGEAVQHGDSLGISKFVILGYTMLEAAVTIQTVVKKDDLSTTFAAGFVCSAYTTDTPTDELFQLVGRAFADFRKHRYPNWKISLLSPTDALNLLRGVALAEYSIAARYDFDDLMTARELGLYKHQPPPLPLDDEEMIDTSALVAFSKLSLREPSTGVKWLDSKWNEVTDPAYEYEENDDVDPDVDDTLPLPPQPVPVPVPVPAPTPPTPPTPPPPLPTAPTTTVTGEYELVEKMEDLKSLPMKFRLKLLTRKLIDAGVYDAVANMKVGKRRVALITVLPDRAPRDRPIILSGQDELVREFLDAYRRRISEFRHNDAPFRNKDNYVEMVALTVTSPLFFWDVMPVNSSRREQDQFRRDYALSVADANITDKRKVTTRAKSLTRALFLAYNLFYPEITDLYHATANDFREL